MRIIIGRDYSRVRHQLKLIKNRQHIKDLLNLGTIDVRLNIAIFKRTIDIRIRIIQKVFNNLYCFCNLPFNCFY